jgi:hypothetical protein
LRRRGRIRGKNGELETREKSWRQRRSVRDKGGGGRTGDKEGELEIKGESWR